MTIYLKSFLQSILYALIGVIPSMTAGALIALALISIASVAPSSIPVAPVKIISQLEIFLTLAEFFRSYSTLFIIGIGIFSGFIFFLTLRLLNPNFSKTYFRNEGISTWRLSGGFLLVLFLTSLASYAFSLLDNLLAVIPATYSIWFFFHRYGLWGDLRAFAKDKEKRSKIFSRTHQEQDKHFVAIGIRAAILCLWTIIIVASLLVPRLVANYLAVTYTFESQWFLPSTFFFWYVLSFAIDGMFILALTYALSDISLPFKQTAARLCVSLLMTFVTFLFVGSVSIFAKKHDAFTSVYTATGVNTTTPFKQRILIFEDTGVRGYTVPVEASLAYSSNAEDLNAVDLLSGIPTPPQNPPPIPCSPENVQKITQIQNRLSEQSFLLYPLHHIFAQCLKGTWEINQSLRAASQYTARTHNFFTLDLIVRRNAFAEDSPLHDQYIKTLKDDKKIRISKMGMELIDQLLAHYAEAKKTKGSITGRIFLNDTEGSGVRIGLVQKRLHEEARKNGKYNFGVSIEKPIDQYLVASTKTDTYGRFFFQNLKAGSYYLGIIMPDTLPSDVKDLRPSTERPIGAITVDENTRSHPLASIVIAQKGKSPDNGVMRLRIESDADGDNLSNEEEAYYGTSPSNSDTDGDGFSDYEELNNGYDPTKNDGGRYMPKTDE